MDHTQRIKPMEQYERDASFAGAVMRMAARTASMDVFDAAMHRDDLHGMGTTLTALLFDGGMMHVAHVGDSRAFLFRDEALRQLSRDHTWIGEQVQAGALSEQEARISDLRHIITRSIGVQQDVDVDLVSLAAQSGDCVLLCSDGLTNYVENDELGRLMAVSWYGGLADTLVELANERGGEDNISVVVVYAANELS